jgi:DNA-binding CsgD family transcriptional regulator
MSDLKAQIRCDFLSFDRPVIPPCGEAADRLLPLVQLTDLGKLRLLRNEDSEPQATWFDQTVPVPESAFEIDDERAFEQHYWECEPCSYPDQSGDLRSVTKLSDFYSTRQWHSTGMYQDVFRQFGVEREFMLCLPNEAGRLLFFRGPGPDFSERDCGLLSLLRPHLHEAYLHAERRRHCTPQLTRRHWELLNLLAAGCTDGQIARRLGISEGTVRKHLENVYGRLNVSSRTAAVTRAFSDRAAG